jgi:TonB family protein
MRHFSRLFLIPFISAFAIAQQSLPLQDAPLAQCDWKDKKITPPVLISNLSSEFPVEARFQQMDGLCIVSFVVKTDGTTDRAYIVHCTDDSFEQSTLNAVRDFQFKPAMTEDGKPVAVTINTVYRYNLMQTVLNMRSLLNLALIPGKGMLLDALRMASDSASGEDTHPFLDKPLITYNRTSRKSLKRDMSRPIHASFRPQGSGIPQPDGDGVFAYTRSVTGPRVTEFVDEGYGEQAFSHEGKSLCQVEVTIRANGKAENLQLKDCERSDLREPLLRSIARSRFTPGLMHGKAVNMRAMLYIEYGD